MGLTQRIQTTGFKFGRSRTSSRAGLGLAAVAIVGFVVLFAIGMYALAWVWLLAWLAVALVWSLGLWTLGDSDSRASQAAIYGDGGFAPEVTDPTHVISEEHGHH